MLGSSVYVYGGHVNWSDSNNAPFEKLDLSDHRKYQWQPIYYGHKKLSTLPPMLQSAGFCAINDSELLIIGGLDSYYDHNSKAYVVDTNTFEVRELRNKDRTFDCSCPDNQLMVL